MKKTDQQAKPATTAADLEKQAADLAKRLTALEAEESQLDALVDFERVAQLAGQRAAIAKALDLASERLAEARRAEHLAAKEAAEIGKQERKIAALGAAQRETRSLISVIMHFDQSVAASFDAALAECGAAGAWPTAEVATMAQFRRQLADTLAALGRIDPVLIGKPPAPSKQEVMIAEARSDLERARRIHSDMLAVSAHYGSSRQQRIDEASEGVIRAQKRLASLTGESFTLDNARAELARLARYLPGRQQAESQEAILS